MVNSTPRKRISACDLCRARKIKCNGEKPCNVCVVREEHCTYTTRSRRRARRTSDEVGRERLRALDDVIQESAWSRVTPSQPTSASLTAFSTDVEPSSPRQGLLSRDEISVKYHGPHSALSVVCSKPAIQWISQKLGNDHFQPVATRLVQIIGSKLWRLPAPVSRERKPDPPVDEVWQYVDAYFAEAPEMAFGAVRRDLFQPRLEAHLIRSVPDNNPAVYAIRNCIFATGCRTVNAPRLGYTAANALAYGWFENALSVHTEILYMPTTHIAVTALVIMAYYAEGIGGPMLPHMLSSCAIRLACAKGLHCEPCPSWGISEAEKRHRRAIFWAAYCIDRNIASSSGRPPTICDHAISCKPPEADCSNGFSAGVYSMSMVRLQRLTAQASMLPESASDESSSHAFLNAFQTVQQEIQALEVQLRPSLDLRKTFDPLRFGNVQERDMALRLRYKYLELLFCVHRSIAYPWLRPALRTCEPEYLHDMVLESVATLSWASNQVLLNIAELHLGPNCPYWMAVIVPFYACIDVFTRIVDDQDRASSQIDLALLELGVAHYARLDLYSKSQCSLPFAREMVQIVNDLHMRAQNRMATPSSNTSKVAGFALQEDVTTQSANTNDIVELGSFPMDMPNSLDFEWWNNEFDNWNLDGWL